MTGRERVIRCINYQGPDRCPMVLPPPYPRDVCFAEITEDPEWRPYETWDFAGCRQWEDEWHNVWKCLPNTTRGEVVKGALVDWTDLSTYTMPRMDLPMRYDRARETFAKNSDLYRIGTLPGFPFAIMRYMRTVEEFLADVLLYPDEVAALQREVVELLKRCLDQWASTGCDGLMFAEDWGTQERLLVSPRLWHDTFEPGFRELTDYARALNIDLWMHSCGYIKDIIPTLVDIGIKVLQLDQPKLSGLDFLVEQCRGRTALWSPVDIQRDLPTGDEVYIRACARELIDAFGPDGGFICGAYPDPSSLGAEPRWQDWASDEFVTHALNRPAGA